MDGFKSIFLLREIENDLLMVLWEICDVRE